MLVAIALTLIGLTIAGAATYGSLKSFLSDRIDQQLEQAVRNPRSAGLDAGPRDADDHDDDGVPIDGERVFALYSPDNKLVDVVPTGASAPQAMTRGTHEVDISGESYRFVNDRAPRPYASGYSLAVGIPLADMNATLNRLLMLELVVGALALLATGLIGWKLVGLGMKPLGEIEKTAGAIAEGDLSKRIADENRDTEVGRLGHSLNVMLGRIEESFAEREASERRLRQFVADASHELQTPLTSVRGYAELFRRGAADRPEDLKNAMGRIESEAERMGVLVDDLLLLARLDQGRPLLRERVDLGAAARELAGDAQVVAPDHPIAVTVDGDVHVIGDEVRLRQIISNLLSNARTHTPAGTAIDVSVRRINEDVLLQVNDDGNGLTPEHLERVFERFFRADPSRARASGGTGLGLSIVAAIARAHGGDAHVESSPGAGATFSVRLPVAGPPELPDDSKVAPV